MEQLLSVEIIRDKCRCCLKQFLSRHDNKIQVTTKLQDIFLDFLNEEVNIDAARLLREVMLNSYFSWKMDIYAINVTNI